MHEIVFRRGIADPLVSVEQILAAKISNYHNYLITIK